MQAGVNVNVVRLLRIFKVLRIFGKMKALQHIIIAISATMVPVRPHSASLELTDRFHLRLSMPESGCDCLNRAEFARI